MSLHLCPLSFVDGDMLVQGDLEPPLPFADKEMVDEEDESFPLESPGRSDVSGLFWVLVCVESLELSELREHRKLVSDHPGVMKSTDLFLSHLVLR